MRSVWLVALALRGFLIALPGQARGRSLLSARQGHLAAVEAPSPWRWSRLAAQGEAPGGRQGHAAVEVGERVYVLGGCLQELSCYNDVFVLDTEAQRWASLAPAGDLPEPRGGHSATLVSHSVVVYGGANSEQTFGDLYALDLVKLRWSRLLPQTPGAGAGPGRRTGHAAAAGALGEIFVFGGYSPDGVFLNDLWVLSRSSESVSWSKLAAVGDLPAPREAHSLTYVDGRLILFGGYTAASATTNEVHAYDIKTQRWALLEVAGSIPSPRQAHTAARHGRALVVAGGCDVAVTQPICFADVWSLDLARLQWQERSTDSMSWSPREGHSATFVRGRMFTFGGCDLSSSCYNDVAALDTQDACPSDCGSHGSCVDGAFCRCATVGFTGHDCMQPLVCASDCGEHGACSQDGQCVCENGWSGSGCEIELPCPGAPTKCSGKGTCLANGTCHCLAGHTGPTCDIITAVSGCKSACSGHGECSAAGQCACFAGWSGEACDVPVARPALLGVKKLALLDAFALPRDPFVLQGMKKLALLDPFASSHHGSHAKAKQPDPRIEDFGVQKLNDNGRSGVQASCEQNCNFRGLCENEVCYCQPGFHGDTCAHQETSTRGTVPLPLGLVIGAASFGVSFLLMMIPVHMNAQNKKHAEAQAGYNI